MPEALVVTISKAALVFGLKIATNYETFFRLIFT